MKKLSVSLIAVVAVLFAVASAFTTRGSKMADPYAAGWHQVLSDEPIFFDTDPLALEQSSYESQVYSTDKPTIEAICPDDYEELVCGALFNGMVETPTEFVYRAE